MIIGSKIIFGKNLTSTNTHASVLLKMNHLQEGTIIYTNFQTEGRGQKGNSWESEDGKNLLISIILFPTIIKPPEQFLISKAVSLGICDFLQRHVNNVSIKWPNDIYVNDDKIAGILIDVSLINNEIENAIAGIGLNINQEKFHSDAPNPVSLSQLKKKNFDLNNCLATLAIDLDKRYKQLLSGQRSLIDKEYISRLYRFKKWSEFMDPHGIFEGRIISVSDSGDLKIEDRRGRVIGYSFKEVTFM